MAARNAIALGLDVALHLDPRYHRMPGSPFSARLKNALTQTFIARKDWGGSTFNFSEVIGSMGAGLVANAWEPTGYNGWGDGLERGAMGLAYHTLKNVLREFLPDIIHWKARDSAPVKANQP